MSRGPSPYDPVVDAEIVLYRDSGWSYESIGSFFGISPKTAERRYKKCKEQRKREKEAMDEPAEAEGHVVRDERRALHARRA